MKEPLRLHCCQQPGCQLGLVEVSFNWRRLRFEASCPIESVFGAEVDGRLRAYGLTKGRALRKLEEEKRGHYEALWA